MSTTVSTAGIQKGARGSVRDSNGIPYVLTENSGNIQLWKGNSTTPTSFSEVDSADNPNDANYSGASIAIDSSDVIHIAFFDDDTGMGAGGGAKYVTVTSDQWGTPETVADILNGVSATGEPYSAIAIDANDIPHVTWIDRDTNMGGSYRTVFYANKVGGSWNTAVEVEGATALKSCINPDIVVDADNNPVIAYIHTGTACRVGFATTNNPSSFTLSSARANSCSEVSLAVDTGGNHHFSIILGTSLLIDVVHSYGDSFSTFTDNASIGATISSGPISIVCDGLDKYVFFEDSSSDIRYYYKLDGGSWTDGGVLETGTFSTTKAKWAYWADNDSGGALRTKTTYYFDGSDAVASDPDAAWSNETNADDGSTTTDATNDTTGSETTNYLQIEGTNAPASGDTPVAVLLRFHDGTAWTDFTNCDIPSGGWTWAKIQALETRCWRISSMFCAVYEDGNAGSTRLGLAASTTAIVSRVEILVLTVTSAAELDYTFDDGSGIEFNTLSIGGAPAATTTERTNPSSFRRPGHPGQF